MAILLIPDCAHHTSPAASTVTPRRLTTAHAVAPLRAPPHAKADATADMTSGGSDGRRAKAPLCATRGFSHAGIKGARLMRAGTGPTGILGKHRLGA